VVHGKEEKGQQKIFDNEMAIKRKHYDIPSYYSFCLRLYWFNVVFFSFHDFRYKLENVQIIYVLISLFFFV
jgi:hypothetical protein